MRLSALFPPVIRNIESDELFENFFVFSILSIVVIRIFLELTNYPQLSGGGLHFAHLIWGGFFMVTAQLLFFFFLNKSIHQLASILAGIGFGTFIDELGKFITADNNYFFQPAIALIYSILVGLYLVFRWTRRQYDYTSDEYIANALEATKEALIHDFDVEEQRLALEWLRKADQRKPFTKALNDLIKLQKPVEVRLGMMMRIRHRVLAVYRKIVLNQRLTRLAVIFFAIQAIGYLSLATLLLVYRVTGRELVVSINLNFFGWGLVISLTTAMALLIAGLLLLLGRSSRLRSFRFFRYSLMVNILLVTFFAFYFNQLYTLMNLIGNILFLKGFEYAGLQEEKLRM